jgi:hypothetical protein
MMRLLLIVLFTCLVTFSHAQTRKIAHRSHGGQSASFVMLLDDDHAGMPPIKQSYWELEHYELAPWVTRIRQHYENIAAQGPPAETQSPEEDSLAVDKPASSPNSPVSPTTPAVPTSPKKPAKSPAPEQKAAEAATTAIPRFVLAKAKPENTQGNGGLILLAGLLIALTGSGVALSAGVFRKNQPS